MWANRLRDLQTAYFSEKINEIMSVQRPLEKVERDAHEMATTCRICKSPFTESNPKCHHHNHVSGDYLFAACQDCNLKLKPKVSHHGYVVVCLFHNLASYDSAFILKNFDKKYVAVSYTHLTLPTIYSV